MKASNTEKENNAHGIIYVPQIINNSSIMHFLTYKIKLGLQIGQHMSQMQRWFSWYKLEQRG